MGDLAIDQNPWTVSAFKLVNWLLSLPPPLVHIRHRRTLWLFISIPDRDRQMRRLLTTKFRLHRTYEFAGSCCEPFVDLVFEVRFDGRLGCPRRVGEIVVTTSPKAVLSSTVYRGSAHGI